jgi:glycosyltransferase involved in cell wall biosynthesis
MSMKLTVYVHDLFYEIGHSNVTLNSLEYIDGIESTDIKFVVFTSENRQKLFSKDIKTHIHYVPFSNIKPVLVKVLWFQIYTFIYSIIFDNQRTKLSVGMANLNCDISILHFIHEQWGDKYFKLIKPRGISLIYKKVFFSYLNICERIVFNFRRPKLITVSEFMKVFIKTRYAYQDQNIKTIHSGFDLARFSSSGLDHKECLQKLISLHPEMKNFDSSRPTSLFIGAFERKGLSVILEQWKTVKPNSNLIIIGKSESGEAVIFEENTIHIPYTKEINLFYEISDYFLFPTIYEPFGMVIIEALIKGLHVYTTKENVGASEIILEMEGVTIVENNKRFELPKSFKILTNELRNKRINERKTYFKKFNWEEVSKDYKTTLNQWEKN